jgi:hypothetical protein
MSEQSSGASASADQALVPTASSPQTVSTKGFDPSRETQEQRARRLFDEMARNIGRETVNHIKRMYPEILSDRGRQSKSWETSVTNHVRNDINWRLRPLLMAMIAMHREWEEERDESAALKGDAPC